MESILTHILLFRLGKIVFFVQNHRFAQQQIVFWAIRSVQKVGNDSAQLSGLEILQNSRYGNESSTKLLFSARIFDRKYVFLPKPKLKNRSHMRPEAKPLEAK